MSTAFALPRAGLAYGMYPQRPAAVETPLWRGILAALATASERDRPAVMPAALEQAFEAQARQLCGRPEPLLAEAVAAARAVLAREGLHPAAAGVALAVVAEWMHRRLDMRPFRTQVLAAWLLLEGRFAEMATGEGKTLAMGLAAAVAALAGTPMHVLTANDYLAARDQAFLEPVYAALGLSSGCVVAATPPAERPPLYRRAIVHSTAKEVGFDYLRDHCALQGQRDPRWRRAQAWAGRPLPEPMLPGLCFALLDEADSLLLDEAAVPLLLAQPGPPLAESELRAAWACSAALRAGHHYTLLPELQRALLSDDGRRSAAGRVPQAARRFCDLVEAALTARHLLQRERQYVVSDAGIDLIDEPTGRVARGRRWSGHLYPMVQIKEGLAPSPPAVTAAQITFPRLFTRYLRLAGLSGTLREGRYSLRSLYGAAVSRVPLGRPCRLQRGPERLYADAERRWAAVVGAVQRHAGCGRPVLVGVESVASAAALAARLGRAGVPHQRLDAARNAEALADEAMIIARAGSAGCVTVATNMAGRGTDIRLDAQAAAAGGLHVIATVRNRSRRIDRQLIGRSARQGDPGSSEALLALDDRLLVQAWPAPVLRLAAALSRPHDGVVPGWLAQPLLTWAQRSAEWADALRRRQLLRAERQTDEMLGFAGPSE